ncbi:MAG: Fe-S cluster assembly protein SufB, partial [Bdellovibrionaceae bacterium]|nr:Fe-S cluster assembly protein SufB [Pseudobdellovibrionaceae bacterium]
MENKTNKNFHQDYEYKYGFETQIASDQVQKGLSSDIIRLISRKKEEPEWMLEYRLKAFEYWQKLEEPTWAHVRYPKINFQDISYYSAPKTEAVGKEEKPKSLQDLDPELIKTFERLGIPVSEQKRISGVAVDVVFDSVSVGTTHKEELDKVGVIFCSISEAIKKYPDLVRKYLGSIVPFSDNYYAALNAAVFTDGSFCYIPKGVKCPIDLSTYFRINAKETGQFERTLLVADEGSFVNYLEGCTAVVELIALDNAEIKYSTVQNWYTGDKEGKGGIYNFVTKRGKCAGVNSKISWTQVESGSAITWKYPSVILQGDHSEGYFYSV